MKKKIEDLTIRDIKNICKSKRHCNKNCVLIEYQWCCLGLRNMTEKELKQEIDYERR